MLYQTLKTSNDVNGNARAINVYFDSRTGEAVGLSSVNSAGPQEAAKAFSELVRISGMLKNNPVSIQYACIQYAYPLGYASGLDAVAVTPAQYNRLRRMLNGDWAAVFPAYADTDCNPRRGPGAPKITKARMD